jgi:hypothetical protein
MLSRSSKLLLLLLPLLELNSSTASHHSPQQQSHRCSLSSAAAADCSSARLLPFWQLLPMLAAAEVLQQALHAHYMTASQPTHLALVWSAQHLLLHPR